MGMDAVELVMGVEEAFSIDIPDRDAEQMISVGQLYDYVRRRVGRQGVCPSRHVFYRLRRALECVSGVARRALRPHTSLDVVLSVNRRTSAWNAWTTYSDLKLPRLRRPEWVFAAGMTIFASGGVSTLICSLAALQLAQYRWTCVLLTSGALFLLWLLTAPLAIKLTRHCLTLGDLTRIVTTMNTDRLQVSLGWSDSEIWQTVRVLVSQQMGISVEQVTPEKEFVRDLGMG